MSKHSGTTRNTMLFFWRSAWRYPLFVCAILLLMPVTIAVEQYISTVVLADILNRLANDGFIAGQVWQSFGNSIIWYGALLIIGSIGWRLVDVFQWRLEGHVEQDIAQKVYDHLLSQSANFHANRFGGSLVSQTNKLLGSYIRFADTTIYQVYQLIIGLVVTIIILTPRAPAFVVCLLILAFAYIISGIRISRSVRHLSGKHANTESKQTGYLADSITNIMAIKSFARSTFERKRFGEHTQATRKDLLAVMHASQKQMAAFSTMNRIIMIAALVLAIMGVVNLGQNIATIFLIFSFTTNLVGQLWTFCNNSLRNYNRAFGDAKDMIEIMGVNPEVADPENPEKVRIKDGEIVFDNVDFSYHDTDEMLFKNFSLKISPGEKVGLIGHSGGGKTTVTKILLRFNDIQSGAIRIDGQNIADITQDDLRSKIAYVPQEPLLFHRTLTENISYGRPNAAKDDIIKTAELAHAHEFIVKLPDGYQTLVGERGVKLSGGQRQRVAIARAMLKNAPILVLDEATSALDSESEVLIQDALWKLMEGRTAIVIAHRLSTIQKMDRIVVMEEGSIVEEGTHKKLLEADGVYAKLWTHQSGGFIEE